MTVDLRKKYGLLDLSTRMHEGESDPKWSRVSAAASLKLSKHTNEVAFPNVDYQRGLPVGKDSTPQFSYMARGMRGTPGVYWQTYLSDALVKSSVDGTHEGLASGVWSFEAPENTPEELQEEIDKRAAFCQHALIDAKPSSWSAFLKGWTFGDRVYGFSLWEVIDAEDGSVSALKYRRPGTVKRWLFSEDGREWVGTEFEYSTSDWPDVIVSRENLLLSTSGIGLDLEGISALRPVVRWVEIKQLVTQIETAAAESHGNGTGIVRDPDGVGDTKDHKKLIAELDAAAASDDPILYIGRYLYERISPSGQIPDFESMRRYCDEQIGLALSSTGSLVGLGDTGTYALAEVKDNAENVRRVRYFGQQVCNLVNEELVPRMMRNAFESEVPREFWPVLTYSVGSETKDPAWLDKLAAAVTSGLVDASDFDVQNRVRDFLDLPPLTEQDESEEAAENDPFQIAAAHSCVGHAHIGETDAERAIRLGQFIPMTGTFNLSQYDPEKLKNWVQQSNNEIGRALEKAARKYRDRYVYLTQNTKDPANLIRQSQALRQHFQREYVNAITYELNRLVMKGSAAQLRELGVLKPKQGQLALPNVPKDAGAPGGKVYKLKPLSDAWHRHVELQANRIATHAVNVTQSYLDSVAVTKLGPGVDAALKPQIPSASAFAKHAKRYTNRTFNYGREQIVERIQAEAKARGIQDDRVVMEFSSVMEDVSCEPCKKNDGRRYFLGSLAYEKDKPPYYLHEGPADTCLCIMSAILPSESGYEEIIAELDSGGSKVESGLGFSDPYISSILELCQC